VTAPPEPGGPSAFSGDPFPSPALASGGAPWPVAVPARDDVDLDGLAECVPDSASRARDAGSFAQVFDEHYVGLVRLALAHCGDRALAEDAVAEAYARVWPRFSRGTVADVDAYLRRAVLNEIRGRFRRRVVEAREEQRRRVDWRAGISDERNVDDRAQLLAAIRALPAKQRDVIVLRFYEDLSEEETARTLGIRIGTVKSRCSRALERLRHEVGSER